ncbi:MAG TPA: hypothetical protein VII66_05485, partial [Gemmatimonadaceae bacterium]
MANATTPPDVPMLPWKSSRADASESGPAERLVRETWRHYYVARLAEAQFGPDSLEASLANSRAVTSYRELRGTLREMDPYYRSADRPLRTQRPTARHLTLVPD